MVLPVAQLKKTIQSCRKDGYGRASGKRSVRFFQEGLQKANTRSNKRIGKLEFRCRNVLSNTSMSVILIAPATAKGGNEALPF